MQMAGKCVLIFVEFRSQAHHSIALETLYNFLFGMNTIQTRVRPERTVRGDPVDAVIRLIWRQFAAQRFTVLFWSQNTFNRASHGLSIDIWTRQIHPKMSELLRRQTGWQSTALMACRVLLFRAKRKWTGPTFLPYIDLRISLKSPTSVLLVTWLCGTKKKKINRSHSIWREILFLKEMKQHRFLLFERHSSFFFIFITGQWYAIRHFLLKKKKKWKIWDKTPSGWASASEIDGSPDNHERVNKGITQAGGAEQQPSVWFCGRKRNISCVFGR